MKFMVLLLAVGYVVRTESSLNELPVHPGVGGLYRGPNSETIIKGPDGSVITAEAEGGTIHTQGILEPIVVADLDVGPVVSITSGGISSTGISGVGVPVKSVSAVATPIAAVRAPVLATVTALPLAHTIEIVQPDAHIIDREFVDAPVVEPQQSSDLVGPSGSISTRGSSSVISGPASTTISEPARILVAAPVVAGIPIVASITTPLLSGSTAEIIPDSVATASIGLQPTISTVTVGPSVDSAISISTIVPPTSWESSTILPPIEWNAQPSSIQQGGLNSRLLSTNQAHLKINEQSLGVVSNVDHLAATVEPASSYGVISNVGKLTPISSTVRPELSVTSTQLPPPIISQELVPPPVSQTNLNVPADYYDSLNQAYIDNRQLNINPSLISSANIIPPEIGLLPAGAIDLGRIVTVSSTPRAPGLYPSSELPNVQSSSELYRPELSVSPAQFPPSIPSQELLPPAVSQINSDISAANFGNLNKASDINRQLNINPSLIPSANIIPSGSGQLLSTANDLGSTVTISPTQRNPGLYLPTESPNIQRPSGADSIILDNDIRNTDERLISGYGKLGQLEENQQTFIQNLVANPARTADVTGLYGRSIPIGNNVPLLRPTNPVQIGISQNGIVGSQLARYGIDASQINLSNVPLSSVVPFEDNNYPLSQSIEDSSSALWNRYGRDVKTKGN